MTTPCKNPYYIAIPSLSLCLFVYNIYRYRYIYIFLLQHNNNNKNSNNTAKHLDLPALFGGHLPTCRNNSSNNHTQYIYIYLPARYPHKTHTETRTSDPQLRNVGSSKRRKWSSTAPGSPCPPSGQPGGWLMGDIGRCCGTGTNYRWFINIRWLY